eukprot:7194018-Pyramimonas_sp.AAC.1
MGGSARIGIRLSGWSRTAFAAPEWRCGTAVRKAGLLYLECACASAVEGLSSYDQGIPLADGRHHGRDFCDSGSAPDVGGAEVLHGQNCSLIDSVWIVRR